MSIRVFIIDEHNAARESLAHRLANLPDLAVVGSTGDGEEGLNRVAELHPDVVLLDTKMKNADGMDVCRRACHSNKDVKVAVLTSFDDPEERMMAGRAGASGYLLKSLDTPHLARWIKKLHGESRE